MNRDQTPSQRDRQYGVDLLKLISMCYVIVLHSLGHGGLLSSVTEGTIQYYFSFLLEIMAYGAVNIFALITGFTINTKETNNRLYVRLVSLWFEVVFYGLIITIIIGIVSPDSVAVNDYFTAIFPVIKNEYWYFTAYIGAAFLLPIICVFVENSSVATLKKVFILLILVFSVLEIVVRRWIPSGGYTFVWLAILFLLGAIIRKCEIGLNVGTGKLIAGIIVFSLIHCIWRTIGADSFSVIGIEITKKTFTSYVSPLVLCPSIMYLILFSRLEMKGFFKRVIALLAPGAFAAYLINDHRLFRRCLIANRFSFLATKSVITIATTVIVFSILFVVAASIIDRVRLKLFGIMHIKSLSETIVMKINSMISGSCKG